MVPKDNADEFALIVSLPVQPEEVAWEENSEKKTLTAVIRFSSEGSARLLAELGKNGGAAPETLSIETWYPAELIAKAELSGESSMPGRSFAAEPFLNPPYTKGKITHIDTTDYFILRISA